MTNHYAAIFFGLGFTVLFLFMSLITGAFPTLVGIMGIQILILPVLGGALLVMGCVFSPDFLY
jgi:hypothetical protein